MLTTIFAIITGLHVVLGIVVIHLPILRPRDVTPVFRTRIVVPKTVEKIERIEEEIPKIKEIVLEKETVSGKLALKEIDVNRLTEIRNVKIDLPKIQQQQIDMKKVIATQKVSPAQVKISGISDVRTRFEHKMNVAALSRHQRRTESSFFDPWARSGRGEKFGAPGGVPNGKGTGRTGAGFGTGGCPSSDRGGIVRGQVSKPGLTGSGEPNYSLTFGIQYPEYRIIIPMFYHWQSISLNYVVPDYGIPFDRLVYFLEVRETGKTYRSDDFSTGSIGSLGGGRYTVTFKNVEVTASGWKTNVGPFTIQYAR